MLIGHFLVILRHEMSKSAEQIAYEKQHLALLRKMRRACVAYDLIADGDKVLIGLSGGKDSLALVELLGQQAQIWVPHFEVIAAHVSISNIGYQSDIQYLESFCAKWKVPFIHQTTHYEELPPNHRNKNHCFLCSWYRRKALFDTALKMGCNKIALGHHRDDILETLLMNMVFEGNISTMPPSLSLDTMPLRLIRPLCLIDERDLETYAALSHYQQIPKRCPFEHDSMRSRTKKILNTLESLNPHVRDSLWSAMGNIKEQYL
mgnify:CR=1 FL=1